jgi:hypothetical protein
MPSENLFPELDFMKVSEQRRKAIFEQSHENQ